MKSIEALKQQIAQLLATLGGEDERITALVELRRFLDGLLDEEA